MFRQARIKVCIAALIALTIPISYSQDETFSTLSDCTIEGWEETADYWTGFADDPEDSVWLKIAGIESDPAKRNEVLVAATEWANDNGYLPCSFQMCGLVMKGQEGNHLAYLSPVETMFIGPEVLLAFNISSLEVRDIARWHSGCRARSP